MATRWIGKIKASLEPFRQFPKAAPAREQLASGLRAAFCGHYAIYFAHDERELVIVRVLHGARDAAALSESGGFAWLET
jgi:toxin ParE1/3/4